MSDVEQVPVVNATGLIVRPGDTLILAIEGRLRQADADRIGDAIRARLPQLADVVLVSMCNAMAAFRPDDAQ